MNLKKMLTAVCAAVLAGATLVSCSQPAVSDIPEFVEGYGADVSEENVQVDGNQKYMAYEIDFVSDKEYEAPVYNVEMDVVFTNKATGTSLTLPAFWDGGTSWKVRYALTEVGTWTWETSCSDESNTGLHGLSGEVECVEYVGNLDIYKHGFVKTEEGKNYFVYDDGTPFFYLGDTHWTLPMENIDGVNTDPYCERVYVPQEIADLYGITSMFKHIMDYRAKQGFTVIQSQQLAVWNGASGNSWMGDAAGNIFTYGVNDLILDKFQELDRYFDYIAEKGFVHANSQFSYPEELINAYFREQITDEEIDALCRYWVARYSAYPVMWSTAQEIDNDYYEYGGCTPENNPWKMVIEAIAKYDPYDHPSTAHGEGIKHLKIEDSVFDDLDPHAFYAIQWYPKLGSIQDIDWEAMKGYYNNPGFKPVVNYEGHYDHHWAGEFKTRTQGWLAYLNGQFGFGYGAPTIWSIFWTVNDIGNAKPAMYDDGFESYNRDWSWFQGLYSEGAVVMSNMKDILTQYEWWKLVPVFDGNEYFSPAVNVFSEKYVVYPDYSMATIGNELYIGYFYGKKEAPYSYGKLTGMENGQYKIYWYNNEVGFYSEPEIVTITDGTYDVCTKPWKTDCVFVAELVK
ncbi:MAG: DUF4038 domain-containing protein [Clostridia bacterium]|nr:DUF4038 domain-containing protein [Clostridia bacterium]